MPNESKNKEKKVKTAKQKSHFLKDTKAELKKVIWPTPKQLANNTLAVVSIVILIGAIVLILDFAFDRVNQFGVEKLKAAVQSNKTNTTEVSNTDSNNETVNSDNTVENTSSEVTENQAVENAQ